MTRWTRSTLVTAAALALGVMIFAVPGRHADGGPDRGEARKKFKRLDRNSDGRLARDEFPADDAVWQRADKDGDGSVSFEEAVEIMLESEVEKVFLKLDKDRDGLIRRAEVEATGDKGATARFEAVDTNKDGAVSGEELLKALRAKFQGEPQRQARKPAKTPQLRIPPTWTELLKARDKNGNGRLEFAELKDVPQQRLTKLDRNSDGVLSRDEYDPVRERVKALVAELNPIQAMLEQHVGEIRAKLDTVDLDGAESSVKSLKSELRRLLSRDAH